MLVEAGREDWTYDRPLLSWRRRCEWPTAYCNRRFPLEAGDAKPARSLLAEEWALAPGIRNSIVRNME